MTSVTAVHENDFLLQFIKERESLSSEDALSHYLANGRDSAEKLNRIIQDLGVKQPFDFLDFASGYGMVARHYATVMPQARVTTCDIHPEANAFNREKFGFETEGVLKKETFIDGEYYDSVVMGLMIKRL